MPKKTVSYLLILVWVLMAGCSQSLYLQGRKHLSRGEYEPAIEAFYQEISVHPTNAAAWRELGVAYYKQGNLTKAEDALKQANNIRPDARTHLFLGLIYEKNADYTKAIQAYSTALSLQPRGKTASQIRAHLDRLVQKKIENDIATALANESAIDTDTIPDNTIAVANFDASNLPPELAPIARGLAEFTAIDLSKVHSLTVVERMKLDLILRELKLGTSGYIDPASAPRLGRLMGTKKIVTGSILNIGEDAFKLDAAVVNTVDSSTLGPNSVEGKLKNFFKVQKNLVFKILDELGITPTPEERNAIMEVPTESYLAFMAYCRGLDYQNRGSEWQQAAEQEFTKAVELDPGFRQAEQQRQAIRNLQSSGITYENSLSQFEQFAITQPAEEEGVSGTLGERLTQVTLNIGTIPQTIGTGDSPVKPLDSPGNTGTVIIRGDLDE